MNTPAPIVAPWPSTWERFPVQIVQMDKTNATLYELAVPEGRWWRIIYASAEWTASGVAGNRAVFLTIVPPTANSVAIPAPGSVTAGKSSTVVFASGLSGYTGAYGTNNIYGVTAVPDIIWAPETNFEMALFPAEAGDAASSEPVLAYELYSETYNQQGAPVLIPAPVLA